MDMLTPRRSPNSALSLHTEAVHCQRVGPLALGGLPSLSLSIKCSWIHLSGEGRQASRQLSDASTPSVSQNIIDKAVDQWTEWIRVCEKAKGHHSEHLLN